MVLTPSKPHIARAFGLKASTYDANAPIQSGLINRLLPLIESCATQNGRWIDLGCGTGLLERSRKSVPRKSGRYTGLDIAIEPLRFFKRKAGPLVPLIQGDIDHLPIKPETFEGAVASSVLQWLADPASAFVRISGVLAPGGYCAYSLFVKGSFSELFSVRSLFGMHPPVHCPEPDLLKKSFESAGFDLIHNEIIEGKHYFPDAIAVVKSISGMGGTATADRRILTKGDLAGFCRSYDGAFGDSNGVPLTYRAMIGIGRKRPYLP